MLEKLEAEKGAAEKAGTFFKNLHTLSAAGSGQCLHVCLILHKPSQEVFMTFLRVTIVIAVSSLQCDHETAQHRHCRISVDWTAWNLSRRDSFVSRGSFEHLRLDSVLLGGTSPSHLCLVQCLNDTYVYVYIVELRTPAML